MFFFAFADLKLHGLATLLEAQRQRKQQLPFQTEIPCFLLAGRTGPRWHAAELVHSYCFVQTHVYSHTASHFSEIPTQRGIVKRRVCVCVCKHVKCSNFFSLASCDTVLVCYYLSNIHHSCQFLSICAQRSGGSKSQHAGNKKRAEQFVHRMLRETSGFQSVAGFVHKQTKRSQTILSLSRTWGEWLWAVGRTSCKHKESMHTSQGKHAEMKLRSTTL